MKYNGKPLLLPLVLSLAAGPSAWAMPPRPLPGLSEVDQGLAVQEIRLAATVAVGEDLERERAQGALLHKRIRVLLGLQAKLTDAQYAEAFAKIVAEGNRQRQAYAALDRTLKDFMASTLLRIEGATHGPRSPQKVRQVSRCFAAVTHLVVPLRLAQEALEAALQEVRPGHEARGLTWPWAEEAGPRYGRRTAAVMPAPDRTIRRLLEGTNQDLDALEAKQAQTLEQANQVAQVEASQRLREVARQQALAAAEADYATRLAEKAQARDLRHAEREALAAQFPELAQPEPSPEALAEQLRAHNLLEEAAAERQRLREREERQERLAQREALRSLAAEGRDIVASATASPTALTPTAAAEEPTFEFRWHPAALAAFENLDPDTREAILAVMDKVERGVGKGTDKHSKRLIGSSKPLFELRPQGGHSPYRPTFTLGAAPRTYVLLTVGTKASLDQDLATAAERARMLEYLPY